MEFADVARELLLVAPQDFVAERTARQRAVRKDDRALATAIGKLRKPAPAAWVIDLLAHDGALDDAVDLGPALRKAQADADPDAIRTLRRQRTEVVDALAQAGADLASDAGHPVTPAVLEQVRSTIEAAMADPHAGAAVRSGLLVTALESVGFDAVDLDGALADPDAVPDAWSGSDAPPIPISQARGARKASRASRPAQRHDAATQPDPEPEPEPERKRDPAADRKAARQAETAARTESRDADAALDTAEADLEQAEERRAELQRELERADAEIARLETARDEAEAASDHAREVLAAAQRHRRELGR
ncbi:hypothetical protein [Curtobacterium aurantiacum]|uniref:Transposase n=1 Tax=Curtobacterium aurantiacum TaxID=3236919 RepID=A0ABS5VKG7_9MICO|nr:hypothetical protein [Curtobacterium flaccumfaciens]MBT1546126.1 hypothetical protein [Curtobacterium flaccumfaciens pv. flaccumfaciens]MBT1589313.1 hypothetical protein [Curtobacterium flaccumfaciens pv. flaccumfaciens]MBT1678633.1 hypothetical protein [Curtobacterium flaccumfaciens pv. flaccumfaciens]